MKTKFKDYLLTEGGNAIKNVSRINQENSMATVAKLYDVLFKYLKVTKKDVGVLGSTGKKKPGGSSGDIDVSLDINQVIKKNNLKDIDQVNELVAKFAQKYTKSNVFNNKAVGIISLGFPIENVDGKQDGELVQVDIMFTDNLDFSNWMYYSPAEWESEWKGLYRNSMISSITHFSCKTKEVDGVCSHQLLSYAKGLYDATYSRKNKRGGLNKISKVIDKKFLTNDPQEIVDALLGPSFKYKDIKTFEDIWKAINSPKFIHKKYKNDIIKKFKDDITRKGITMPPQVK